MMNTLKKNTHRSEIIVLCDKQDICSPDEKNVGQGIIIRNTFMNRNTGDKRRHPAQ